MRQKQSIRIKKKNWMTGYGSTIAFSKCWNKGLKIQNPIPNENILQDRMGNLDILSWKWTLNLSPTDLSQIGGVVEIIVKGTIVKFL